MAITALHYLTACLPMQVWEVCSGIQNTENTPIKPSQQPCLPNWQPLATDRGTEYVNSELETYFSDKGVIDNTTAPYTPEQNRVAERFNRTLKEKMRAMLLDAKLGSEHRADAASTATYVKNRSPSSHSSQTPWELFFGRKPDVSGMRLFKSKAYVHVPKQLRRKLDPLSTAGIFIGYEPNSKAYRVLMDSGKAQISRDVIFIERVPSAANKAAATEAEQANNEVSAGVPDSPITVQEDNSEADSTGIDLGPKYSSGGCILP